MPARSDRRRKVSNGHLVAADISKQALLSHPNEPSIPAGIEETNAFAHGASILKEIFPYHGCESSDQGNFGASGRPKTPIIEDIIGRLPSPARQAGLVPGSCSQVVGTQWSGGQHCNTRSPPLEKHRQPWEPPRTMAPGSGQWEPPRTDSSAAGASYRERLRLGGRGALQRATDAGIVPKVEQQSWNSATGIGDHHDANFWAPQAQQPEAMQYDNQLMWNGAEHMQSNDCWGMAMNQHEAQMQYPYMQETPHFQPQLPVDQSSELLHTTPMPHMSGASMLQSETHSAQMQMPVPQQVTPHMQMPMPQTPTDFNQCRVENDHDLMALQLRAAAELASCYED